MRVAIGMALCGVLVAGVAGAASEPASHRTPEDYVNGIEAVKGTPAPADDSNPCRVGLVLNASGFCGPPPETERASLAPLDDVYTASKDGTHKSAIRPAVASHKATYIPPPAGNVLSDLLLTFKIGSADMDTEAQAEASVFAKALNTPREVETHFEIAGHTDASGSPDRNRILSEARAQAVKAFLVTRHVDASRLEAKGYGSSDLARPDAPYDKANRRVEARLLH